MSSINFTLTIIYHHFKIHLIFHKYPLLFINKFMNHLLQGWNLLSNYNDFQAAHYIFIMLIILIHYIEFIFGMPYYTKKLKRISNLINLASFFQIFLP